MFLAAMLVPVSSKLQLVLGWGKTGSLLFFGKQKGMPLMRQNCAWGTSLNMSIQFRNHIRAFSASTAAPDSFSSSAAVASRESVRALTYSLIFGSVPLGRTQIHAPPSSSK